MGPNLSQRLIIYQKLITVLLAFHRRDHRWILEHTYEIDWCF